MGKEEGKLEKERRRMGKREEGKGGKGKEDYGEMGRRTMGKGKKEKGERDMSHSLTGVGGYIEFYIGLIQGFVKYSHHLIR